MYTARASQDFDDQHGGTRQAGRPPVSGIVRPGIKVLIKDCQTPELNKLYAEGIEAGVSFDDIAQRMQKHPACPKRNGKPRMPLIPTNPGYFTVRQCDFRTPGAADKIMELYAEVRPGDPEPRLYSLPIVFPSDNMGLIFQEQFMQWKSSELVHWSEPDPESGILQCMERQGTPDPKAQRRWGGRPTVSVRPCDPNNCAAFGEGECKHTGSLFFWIPGIEGVGLIELPFTSIYAPLRMADMLGIVKTGLGRVSGLYKGKPFWRLSKTHDRITKMNWATARPEKVWQHIIRLDAVGLNMMEVLAGDAQQAAIAAPDGRTALPAPERQEQPAQATASAPDELSELRAQLVALRDSLEWSNSYLKEWVDGQQYKHEDPAKDLGCLADMIGKLTALADAHKARESKPAVKGEVVDVEPVKGDGELPFYTEDDGVPF